MEKLDIKGDIKSLNNKGFDSEFFIYEKAPWYKSLVVLVLVILEVFERCLISSIPLINYFSEKLINILRLLIL